jgi:HSP20 family protein
MTQLMMPESIKNSISHLRQNVHELLDRWRRQRTNTGGNTRGNQNVSTSGYGRADQSVSTSGSGPLIDFDDNGDEVVIVAELPGFDDEDLRIEIAGDRLVLRGEKQLENEERGDDYYVRARNLSAFTRIIPLPPGVDIERVDARFKNGVLQIILPRTEEAKGRQVEVRAS